MLRLSVRPGTRPEPSLLGNRGHDEPRRASLVFALRSPSILLKRPASSRRSCSCTRFPMPLSSPACARSLPTSAWPGSRPPWTGPAPARRRALTHVRRSVHLERDHRVRPRTFQRGRWTRVSAVAAPPQHLNFDMASIDHPLTAGRPHREGSPDGRISRRAPSTPTSWSGARASRPSGTVQKVQQRIAQRQQSSTPP
jgi:hypothetical protein